MGPEGAVNVLYMREIEAAPDKEAARAASPSSRKSSRGFVASSRT
jgi:acetyl-CoA carboxylase carboxyltransferase component